MYNTFMKWLYILLLLLFIPTSVFSPKSSVVYVEPVKPVVYINECAFYEADLLIKFNGVRTHKVVISPYLETVTHKRADSLTASLDMHEGFRQMIRDGVFDYRFTYMGEILASNYCPSTEQIFSQWKGSAAHWSAIIDNRYDVVGIGFNQSSGVVVAIFGDL
jgi:hypothetical protein